MKWLSNKANPNLAVILAFTEDDLKVLHGLHDNHLVFGMYQVWFRVKEEEGAVKGTTHESIKWFLEKFPEVQAIAHLSLTGGYISKDTTKVLSDNFKLG